MVCLGLTHCSKCLTPLRDDFSCPHCEWEEKMRGITQPVHVSPETIEELKYVREQMNKEEPKREDPEVELLKERIKLLEREIEHYKKRLESKDKIIQAQDRLIKDLKEYEEDK